MKRRGKGKERGTCVCFCICVFETHQRQRDAAPAAPAPAPAHSLSNPFPPPLSPFLLLLAHCPHMSWDEHEGNGSKEEQLGPVAPARRNDVPHADHSQPKHRRKHGANLERTLGRGGSKMRMARQGERTTNLSQHTQRHTMAQQRPAAPKANKQASKQANKQASKQTNKQTNKQASKQTNKQANKQTSKQANKQTNKHTNKQTSKQASKACNKISKQGKQANP